MLKYLKELDFSKKNLRKFGRTMFVCLFLLGLVLFFRHKSTYLGFWYAGFTFLVLAQLLPTMLKPVYTIWMGLAFCLGWVNTRIILSIMFYLIITPIGLIMKLFRSNFMDLDWRRHKESYWIKRECLMGSREIYERTF